MPDTYSRIFLLSHMRAYTSLAGHILGSHPEVTGYYELHLGYEDEDALDRQLALLGQHEPIKKDTRYLFDKLLHNDYRLQPERLGIPGVTVLVSLREPEVTIQSIVSLFEKKPVEDLYASPVEATRYYVERLQALATFCQSTTHPYYYYDAELLPQSPEVLLPRLGDWLGLDSPLSSHYRTFSQTGEAGKGDSSERIRSGRIERDGTDYSEVDVPEGELDKARAAYRDCRGRIVDHAADSLLLPGSV